MVTPKLDIPPDRIAAFCRQWRITELALFGSVLREDFRPDSDVDVLVSFAPGIQHGLAEYEAMEAELAAILGRRVDFVPRAAVERSPNWVRREQILNALEPIYVEP